MNAPIPTGEGLVTRKLRLAPEAVVHLGGILAGYDNLASLHGEEDRGVIVLLTSASQAQVLDELLDSLRSEVEFEIVE